MTSPPSRARDLLDVAINWKRIEPGKWLATVAGVDCVLTMNDFPDEPLYTVQAFGDAFDLDDPPTTWRIELPRDA